jgi:hypothetical protein
MSEEVEEEMAQRAEEANERPVHMSPEQWEWYRKTGRMNPSRETGAAQRQLNSTFNRTEDKFAKQKREKFKEKFLTHPIKGERFIDGSPSKWRDLF